MKAAPARIDRIIDAFAVLLVLGGVGLFAYARSALTGIGNETSLLPTNGTAVDLADYYVAQSRMGLFVVGLGVLVGVAAAVRHKLKA
jgi:hypothetical protein